MKVCLPKQKVIKHVNIFIVVFFTFFVEVIHK